MLTDQEIEKCWLEAEAEADAPESEWLLYGQKVAAAAVAAERKKHMTDTQIAEFAALCVMNRRLKLTAREMLRKYKADRGIEA